MTFPKTRGTEAGRWPYGRLGLLIGLCLLIIAAAAGMELALASQEAQEQEKSVLRTYSLEDVVIAALKENTSLRQAEMGVEEAHARLLAELGTAELRGFFQPLLRAGSLKRLELADRAISDESLRNEAADDNAGEGGLRLGFTKAIASGGRFALELDWGAVQGMGSSVLGDETYTVALRSSMTWEQPLGRDPQTLEPWWTIQAAEDAYAKAKLARDAAGRQVILRTSELFVEAVKAQEDLDVALEILESVQEQNRLVQERVSRGMGGPLDLRTAELELAAAQHGVSHSRRRADLAKQQLMQATGLSLSRITRLVPPPPITWDSNSEAAVARALEASTDLKALKIDIDAARRAWRKAQQETWPQVNSSASIDETGAWRVGVEATWYFWDGEEGAQRVEAAALRFQRAAAELENMTEAARLDVLRLYYDYLDGDERVQLAELEVARAAELLEMTRRRYGLRMTTELEMMKALNELRAAKAEHSAAMYNRSLAAIRLFIHTDQVIRVFPNISWGQSG